MAFRFSQHSSVPPGWHTTSPTLNSPAKQTGLLQHPGDSTAAQASPSQFHIMVSQGFLAGGSTLPHTTLPQQPSGTLVQDLQSYSFPYYKTSTTWVILPSFHGQALLNFLDEIRNIQSMTIDHNVKFCSRGSLAPWNYTEVSSVCLGGWF